MWKHFQRPRLWVLAAAALLLLFVALLLLPAVIGQTSADVAAVDQVQKGMHPEEVYEILGRAPDSVSGVTVSCWRGSGPEDRAPAEKVIRVARWQTLASDISVEFDSEGIVVGAWLRKRIYFGFRPMDDLLY
jgi:hypothetical protein